MGTILHRVPQGVCTAPAGGDWVALIGADARALLGWCRSSGLCAMPNRPGPTIFKRYHITDEGDMIEVAGWLDEKRKPQAEPESKTPALVQGS